MMPPEVRAEEVISRMPSGRIRGAEIGVFKGQMSAILLSRLPALTLYMVDSWLPSEEQPEPYIACGDFHAGLNAAKQERCYREALAAVRFALDRAIVLRMDSALAAARVDDRSLDFVFIDGDHSLPGVTMDIQSWSPKVKENGWLCGHDYAHPLKPLFGVKRAVDEAVAENGWTLELGRDMTWFIRL